MAMKVSELERGIANLQEVIADCDRSQVISFMFGVGDDFPRLHLELPEFYRLVNLREGTEILSTSFGQNVHQRAIYKNVQLICVVRIVADA